MILEIPFQPGEKVIAITDSKEVDLLDETIEGCYCLKHNDYIIDGCVWSWKLGWLVCISYELHKAEDFIKVEVLS